jgi:TRAP-type mannitol/chloroaromatic compound transport system permease small subunit
MEAVKKYIRIISKMNEWIGKVISYLIVPLVFITIYEVVMRKFFSSPTLWVFETSNQLYSCMFMLGCGYAMLYGSHASVDVFYRFMNPKRKAIMDICMFIIFFFPFCLILLWKGIFFAAGSWAIWEVSQSVFRMPLYPIKTIIPLMAITLLLQGSTVFIKKLYMVVEGKELTV